MIARLRTQRACLRFAGMIVASRSGVILEIGLGKGRSYDFLRKHLPQREIFAFDRTVHCADEVRPDSEHLILGDFLTTLPAFRERMGRRAVLAHADIGSGDAASDARLAAAVAPLIDALVQPQGLILTDRAMSMPDWVSLPLPAGAGDWPYYIYRAGAA
jgi:hypothetical protein